MFDFLKRQKSQSASPSEKFSLHSTYISTSEFAKVCNVTRFTILNWVKKKKIRAVKTGGGHQRIPMAEVVSYLESLEIFSENPSAKRNASGRFDYCWEHALAKKKAEKCSECIMYGSPTHHCALIATQLGKERIQCEGNCQTCDYWRELFPHDQGASRVCHQAAKPALVPKETAVNAGENDGRGLAQEMSFQIGHSLRDMWNVISLKNAAQNKPGDAADETSHAVIDSRNSGKKKLI